MPPPGEPPCPFASCRRPPSSSRSPRHGPAARSAAGCSWTASRPPASPWPCCRSRTASPPRGARRDARTCRRPWPITVSRPDGTFAVAVPGPSGTPVRLALSGGTASPRVLAALFDSGGDDAGDVRLPKALALAGRVVDERGGPVVGATVTLWPGSGRRPQDASPGLRPAAIDGDEGRRDVPLRGRGRGREPDPRGGPGVRHAGEAAGPGRGARAAGDAGARAGPAGDGHPRRPADAGRGRPRAVRGAHADDALGGGARRTARSSSTARRARRARSWPTAGTAAAPRWCWPRAPPPSPSRSPSPRPRRSPGGWWTPRTAKPLAGVRIVARGQGGEFLARSGPDGRYSMRGLSPQAYRVSAEDDRFVPWSRTVAVAAGTGGDAGRPARPRLDARGSRGGRGGPADRRRDGDGVARRRGRVPGLHPQHGGRGRGAHRPRRLVPGDAPRAGREPAARRAPRRVRGARDRRHLPLAGRRRARA